MALGVFDILHLGHLHYLKQAKALGDELIVVLSSDAAARSENKEPILPDEMRARIVSNLKPVDQTIVDYNDDLYKVIEDIKPGIIALGYDLKYNVLEMKRELQKRGMEIEVKRMQRHPNPLLGSSELIHRIVTCGES